MTISVDLAKAKSDASTRRALSEISLAVAKCKKIVVVTGAGISCSSGIPDFRSSDGLYALVKQQYPDIVLKGRDLFDASLFRDPTSTAVFFTFISQLKQSIDSAVPTPTHDFIKILDTKKKLLRSYTQNIDGFESKVGLLSSASRQALSLGKGKSKINTKEVRNVQLHGDIHSVRCVACSAEYPCTFEHLSFFNEGKSPDCPDCTQRSQARVARSARALRVGNLRPAIVLYDEPHPLGDDIGTIQTYDISRKPDMLVVMGTSLKVHGLKKLVKDFAKTIHASTSMGKSKGYAGKVIFVNRTAPGSEWSDVIDYHVVGDTDTWVERVLEDWKKMRPADWEIQQTLVTSQNDSTNSGALFKTVKNATGTKSKAKAPKKKPATEVENVPPQSSTDTMLYSPVPSSLAAKVPVTPSSPSKRRRAASHYNDLESSPSKKRAQSPQKSELDFGVRGPLFSAIKNSQANVDDSDGLDPLVLDLSMCLESPPAKSRGGTGLTRHSSSETMVDDIPDDLSMQDMTSPIRVRQAASVSGKHLDREKTLVETRPKRALARTRSKAKDVFD